MKLFMHVWSRDGFVVGAVYVLAETSASADRKCWDAVNRWGKLANGSYDVHVLIHDDLDKVSGGRRNRFIPVAELSAGEIPPHPKLMLQ